MKRWLLVLCMVLGFSVSTQAQERWDVYEAMQAEETLRQYDGGRYIENGVIVICVTDVDAVRPFAATLTGDAAQWVRFQPVTYTLQELKEAMRILSEQEGRNYWVNLSVEENGLVCSCAGTFSEEEKQKILAATGVKQILFEENVPVSMDDQPVTLIPYVGKVGQDYWMKNQEEKIFLAEPIVAWEDTVLLPLRQTAEILNPDLELTWMEEEQKIEAKTPQAKAELWVGKDTMTVNAVPDIPMQRAPMVKDGVCYVTVEDLAVIARVPQSRCQYEKETQTVTLLAEEME